MKIVKAFAKKTGMDGAIAYGSSARVVQAISGIVTIFMLSAFFTGIEQGYYYTFHSLLAVQTFFELGFTGVITQFVSHEVAHIDICNGSVISGDKYHLSRLGSLIRFCVKWYLVASLVFLTILIVGGFLFFVSSEDVSISWRLPWIILSVATAVKLFQSPFSAILMGLDKVKLINKIVFYQQILSPLFMWIGMTLGWGLYVVGISSIASVIIWFFIVAQTGQAHLLFCLYKQEVKDSVSYIKEIFPYQWRIALSSLSGYFIFHFMTPILFKYQGAVIAGQVGMSISIIGAIQSFSMTWLNTKIPLYSKLIALKDYNKLDSMFSITMKQMVTICTIIMVLAYVCLNMLSNQNVEVKGSLLGERFLTGLPLALLMVAYITDQFNFSWATYLRCHKKEPFLANSVVTGIACLLAIFIFSKYFTLLYLLLAYAIVRILSVLWGYAIFVTKRKEWH